MKKVIIFIIMFVIIVLQGLGYYLLLDTEHTILGFICCGVSGFFIGMLGNRARGNQ